jgi:hypothetical protein
MGRWNKATSARTPGLAPRRLSRLAKQEDDTGSSPVSNDRWPPDGHGFRAMLEAEIQCSPDFLRLANAISPNESEEKRLLDAMLWAVPRN